MNEENFMKKKLFFFYFKVENIFNFYNKEERLFLILFKIKLNNFLIVI